jgi:hypothetical protein
MGRNITVTLSMVLVKPVADSNRLTFTAVVHIPQGATRSHDGTELHQDLAAKPEGEMEATALVKTSIDEGKAPL